MGGGASITTVIGDIPYAYEYDCKSAYPTTAINLEVLPLGEHLIPTTDLDELLNAKGGYGKICFEFPKDTMMPCLKCEGEDGQVYYPLKGHTGVSAAEMRLALKLGAKITLYKGYFYNDGVPWVANYEKMLIDKRNATDDPVMKNLHKDKGNSLIGKFAQRRMTHDINDLIKISEEWGIPVKELPNIIEGLTKSIKVGSVFFPEWYTIIVGSFRAIMFELAIECGAFMISTDAIFTTKYMGESFDYKGFHFKLEAQGSMTIYRPKLYRIGDELAHHGTNYETAEKVLAKFIPDGNRVTYERKQMTSVRESIWSGDKVGSVRIVNPTLSLKPDNKRKWLKNGNSKPHYQIPLVEVAKSTKPSVYDYHNEDQEKEMIK